MRIMAIAGDFQAFDSTFGLTRSMISVKVCHEPLLQVSIDPVRFLQLLIARK